MPDQTPKRPSIGGKPQVPGKKSAAAPSPAAKAQQNEYQYLPVQCPNCGLEGKVKISRLDRTFTCKQCRKLFYCSLDGTVSGERPPDHDPMQLDAPPPPPPEPWFVRLFGRLPRPVQWTGLGLIALAALYWLAGLVTPAEPLPAELSIRAELAAKSLAYGDWKTLKRMATRATTGSLSTWYDKARPKEWSDVTPESSVSVEVTVNKQLRGYKKEVAMFDATSVANIRVAGKPEQAQREGLAICWTQDDDQQWWIDGERTLGELRPAKKKKKGDSAPGK